MYFKKVDRVPLLQNNSKHHHERYAFYKEKTPSNQLIDIEVILRKNNKIKSIIVVQISYIFLYNIVI